MLYTSSEIIKILFIIKTMTTSFIHIGKTGGSTINHLLRNKIKNYKEYHMEKKYRKNEKYIIWIRNPINRFVSAFNQSYYGIHVNINEIKEFNLDNCLIPLTLKKSIGKQYIFSERYDTLLKMFNSPNHLAESLSSSDVELRNNAISLMMCEDEHMYKGIGWYFDNGDFIKNNNDNILFIGRQEHMKEDIVKLSKVLNVHLEENVKKIRENIYVDASMKYLSPLAVQNLLDWYKDTDYAALIQLHKFGWIDDETFFSYYVYEQK